MSRVLMISSDKAAGAINAYGISKAAMEQEAIADAKAAAGSPDVDGEGARRGDQVGELVVAQGSHG